MSICSKMSMDLSYENNDNTPVEGKFQDIDTILKDMINGEEKLLLTKL